MLNPTYIQHLKKGITVRYGQSDYRIQDDGKGYLHIIIFENGKRRKVGLKELGNNLFEAGTEADYVFNEWYKHYSKAEFLSFAKAELNWLKN